MRKKWGKNLWLYKEDSFARSFYVDNYKIIHYVDAASITEQLIFVDKKYAYINFFA